MKKFGKSVFSPVSRFTVSGLVVGFLFGCGCVLFYRAVVVFCLLGCVLSCQSSTMILLARLPLSLR